MFFCDECAKNRYWPMSMFRSYGKCEICGNVANCSDIPCSALPKEKNVPKEIQEEMKKTCVVDNNIYDEVEQWRIDITGVDKNMSVLVGARASITKEAFEVSNFPMNEHEFKLLWYKIIEKSKNTSIDDVNVATGEGDGK